MGSLRPSRRGVWGLAVILTTLAPMAASFLRPPGEQPGVCVNPGCRCGVHEPGVKCCCAPEEPEGPRQGLFQAGCGGRQEQPPPIPTTDRLAVLPVGLPGVVLPPRRISQRERPLAPPLRFADPPDHVPRTDV